MVDPVTAVGIIGVAVILLAWVWETLSESKKHRTLMDLRFSAVSLLGNALIVIYTWIVNLPIFFVLSVAIMATIIFEIGYSIHVRKVYKDARN